ncbi:hypothetical protein OVA07_00580 [Novosphingobium sp. SL115]|uniref:hypothetical protein n=1 Tax=Novosphingobium sp. SL115 TaxID=2995150 RepID=UPI0022740641|nr:hypothetical protein [Novosphingobium sp. SL115]MCY1669508.1 hypothetical protein [Novosphingobium sp. SL115]
MMVRNPCNTLAPTASSASRAAEFGTSWIAVRSNAENAIVAPITRHRIVTNSGLDMYFPTTEVRDSEIGWFDVSTDFNIDRFPPIALARNFAFSSRPHNLQFDRAMVIDRYQPHFQTRSFYSFFSPFFSLAGMCTIRWPKPENHQSCVKRHCRVGHRQTGRRQAFAKARYRFPVRRILVMASSKNGPKDGKICIDLADVNLPACPAKPWNGCRINHFRFITAFMADANLR